MSERAVVSPAHADNIGIIRGGIVSPANIAHAMLLVIETVIRAIYKLFTNFLLRFNVLIFNVYSSSCR